MYIKTLYNCIVEASKEEKEGFKYIAIDYNSYKNNVSKNLYKFGPYGIALKDGLPELKTFSSKSTIETRTVEAPNLKEQILENIKKQFEKDIDMNVKYKNGFYYKPRYAPESYESLLSAEVTLRISSNGTQSLFPKEIWDATKTQYSLMTFDELKELALFLATIYEKQFQQYKKRIQKVLTED